MDKNFWLDLQLFAEGGEGGAEGAATGVEADVPGRQRLLELGVPADKLRTRANKANASTPKAQTASAAQEQQPDGQDAAAVTPAEEEPKTDASPRMSWEEIVKDPEYNKQMQAVVRSRLKAAKSAEESLQKMAPAIEVLVRKYGLDPDNVDYEALSQKVNDDEAYYEDKALEMGVDIRTARELDQKERNDARQKKQEALTLEQEKIRNHIAGLEQQAEAMNKIFPNFNLREELKNPAFARMTSPSGGVSVEDAYYAIHHRELQMTAMQATAQATTKKLSNAIQAGMRRPREHGTSGQAPSVTTFDYSKASPEQRKAFKEFIRSEHAQGRKVFPGSYKG